MKKDYSKIIFSNLIKFLPFIFLYIFTHTYFNYRSDGSMLADGMILATMVRNFQDHTILTHHL